jgi:hypothetical protein
MAVHNFTDRVIRPTTAPGIYADGDGLYLQVSVDKDGAPRRSWLVRLGVSGGKSRDMGLGRVDRGEASGGFRHGGLSCAFSKRCTAARSGGKFTVLVNRMRCGLNILVAVRKAVAHADDTAPRHGGFGRGDRCGKPVGRLADENEVQRSGSFASSGRSSSELS